MLNPDFRDILSELSAQRAEFLLVGAYALAGHGLARATGDIDIWIRPTYDNAGRVWKALVASGVPLETLAVDDLTTPGVFFQIGVPPRRIDILTAIDGVEFEDAWQTRLICEIDYIELPVLGRDALIRNKRAAGRPRTWQTLLGWKTARGRPRQRGTGHLHMGYPHGLVEGDDPKCFYFWHVL